VAGARSREDEHDARMVYSMSIRHSHSANEHRLAGFVRRMSNLKLPLLLYLMTASKYAEDFTRQIKKCWRETVCPMVRVLSRWSSWNQVADQQMSLTVYVQNFQ
jgi:hypothetical protein